MSVAAPTGLTEAALNLIGGQAADVPFRYVVFADCLAETAAEKLLAWLESETALWKLVEADFYEQFEFSLFDTDRPEAAVLTNANELSRLRDAFGRLFGRRFAKRVSVVAHKLVPGQRIAIHNDHLAGEETHRLIVQLNRGLSDDDGGFLMLFNSPDPSDVHRVLRPLHRTGLAFEISPCSHHAVSRMLVNERYTLIFSLYALYAEDR
jgi:hypothetical protein